MNPTFGRDPTTGDASGRWMRSLVKKPPEVPGAPNPGESFGHETEKRSQ